ncbi:murein L,D-transpeptidase catalytic domain family protein [Marinobacter segnicrescens]|uniref:L,D-transpeptidase catalytic domain n=1 Tax=Marinobacter segnicrescens TaxID=430453 RepID=A0A1I0ALU0_9GAMM|nr:murein L,D-transpeptidase catalytic domain family protein [Marinobacter segnicrescens]SES95263.1 L,D-transpeptidase catalytic domain [Marinobacter segnicrescens]
MVVRGLKRALFMSACVATFILSPLSSVAAAQGESLFAGLSRSAPNLDPQVLRYALDATECAIHNGVSTPSRLAVIDFSLPSSEQRLWIFDLEEKALLLRDLVAHGRNSGDLESTQFSNVEGSHQSSIGLFRAAESYQGKHGYSLRLDGLEPGFNDLARQRAIVIHGADYVDPSWVDAYGRIGRSLGCPAVRQEISDQVVDNLKGGQLVFKYYPDKEWLARSGLLNCGSRTVAGGPGHDNVQGSGS